MRKKILALFLTAAAAISLAACGNATSGQKTEADSHKDASKQAVESTTAGSAAAGSTTEKSTAAKAGTDKKGTGGGSNTLTVWAWDKTFNIYAMQEAEKIYQKDHPDFKLNIVEVPWADMQTQLATILAAGDTSQLPDVLLMQDFAYKKYVMTYKDLFQDLTGSGIDFSQFSKGKMEESVVDGKNYGVPFDSGTEIAAYRTDLLEKAGYKASDLTDIDWNRFLAIGKDVLAKTGYSLFSSQAGSSDLVMQMVQSAGGSIWNQDGSPYFAGNKVLEKSMETYKDLFASGVMATGNSWDEYIATFTSGKTLGAINGCWIMATIQSDKDQSGKWTITDMPSLPDVDGATNYSNQGGSSWGVTENCRNKDLAVDFLKQTFAGSTALYDDLLPSAGVIASWTPAGQSEVYGQPQAFYGGDPVFKKITEYGTKIPAFNRGIYYTEANGALATAVTNICSGADVGKELKTAEDTVKFNMGK